MDIENYYIEKGDGFPLILLHGNGEDCSCFKRQINEFSKHYKVYGIDTRGHGNTPRGNKPFTLNQFAQDLLNFMDKKSIEKAHLFGFSDGGNIAILFSLMFPERVEKLILNGANLSPEGLTFKTRLTDKFQYIFYNIFSKQFDWAKQKKELFSIMVNEPDINPEELTEIKSETLVIAGTNDLIKREHSTLIADKIPNSKLVFMNGNHFIVYKKPHEFNKIVLEFLK